MIEKTDWYPPRVRPVRAGVYQKLNTSTGRLFWARWSGFGYWYMGSSDYQDALHEDRAVPLGFPEWPWRGLKESA